MCSCCMKLNHGVCEGLMQMIVHSVFYQINLFYQFSSFSLFLVLEVHVPHSPRVRVEFPDGLLGASGKRVPV